MWRLVAVALLVLLAPSVGGTGISLQAAGGSTLNRPADPVVLTGADLSALQGHAPGDIVAFRYDGGWQQIPVQADERFVQNFDTIYNHQTALNANTNQLVYADSGTFTGADPDATFDGDDELAFMAADAGGAAGPFSEPAHVVPASGLELQVTDPLAPGDEGWVYLFIQDGTLSPGAGQQYVTYAFNLLSGPYLTTYQNADGPNPENSTLTTSAYMRHFGDRWLDDGLQITSGGASGVDILDRHKALFAPGSCVRSEDTFDNGDSGGFPGEGAFIANKSGPVRAIRSFIGANSGPNTQRDHIFYAEREDIRTALRVHAIPSVMDFFDYSPSASGMTYYNDLNLAGVTVDGNPDSVTAGAAQWEMVSGPQGSLVQSGTYATNIMGFAYTSYYLDDSTPPVTQCTGDAFAYGSSGAYLNQAVPCTDPAQGCTSTLRTTRTMYYLPPGETASGATALAAQAANPLQVSVDFWAADTDGDGMSDGYENAHPCLDAGVADAGADADGDTLLNGAEASLGSDPCAADTDGDGCGDGRELGAMHANGGQRDPLDGYDFFDVPVPYSPVPTSSGKNHAVNSQDVLAVRSGSGHLSSDGVYNDQYDRTPNTAQPWRSRTPNGAITAQDVLTARDSTGDSCM